MPSPAAAFAWAFRRQHRWGLIILAGYLFILGTFKLLILGPGRTLDVDEALFACLVVIPLTATFMYLLAVFSFGLAGDLAARRSMYPPRLFTLPVTTAALAGWPMLYGAAAMAILWAATRLLAVWPPGVHVPMIWPAMLAAALLAWTQALTWMPYALPGLRVIVVILWLAVIDTVVLLALHYQASEPVMLAILAPHPPLAYLAACFAVARARRGHVPDWSGGFARRGDVAVVRPPRRRHFRSPARAQVWFEWRQHGRTLPALVAILLPFELALLFISSNAPATVFWILVGVLLTPPFMAAFVAATVRKASPFLAARPLTSASLVAAKLEATLWSTLAAWLLILVAVPLALQLSGTLPLVIQRARAGIAFMGAPRAVAIALLLSSGLLASTWKQLVQSLYLGMSGREWLVKASVLLAVSFLALIAPLAEWVLDNREVIAALWCALPWIAAVLVGVKMSAAAWIVMRLHDRRLLRDRTLVLGAACWAVAVLTLYGLLAWIAPAPLFPGYLLVLVAILAVPLARLSAAPLALAWNRHQGREGREGSSSAKLPGRRLVVGAVLVLFSVPVGSALIEAVSFHVQNRNNGSLVSSGEPREYLLHVPRSYDRTRPTPLVISMHGAGGWPTQQRDVSGWNRLADEQGFIVVYPSGIRGVGARVWRVEPDDGLTRDVQFISDLIDTLEAAYHIDPTRIYANGLSNGGGMAFALSCTLSDRIAAVGLVAAAQTLPWSWCTDRRAVPMIAFHGTADPMVPYHGGASWISPVAFPDVPTWAASWARRNGCAPGPVEAVVAADVTRMEYSGCTGDAAVVLYRIEGGGHTWPGGQPLPEWLVGFTSNGVDATRRMWTFFRRYQLPGPAVH